MHRRLLQAGAQQAGVPSPADQEPGAQRQDNPALLRLHEGVLEEGAQVLFLDPRRFHQARPVGKGGKVLHISSVDLF